MVKIHILGGPGSGKTTLAQQISSMFSGTSIAESMRTYLAEHGENAEPPDAELLLMRLEKYRIAIPLTAEFVRMYLEKYKEKVFLVKNNADRERLLELLTKT